MRNALDEYEGGFRIGGNRITNLRYADDTALIACNAEEMQDPIDVVNVEGREFGLNLNVKKTENMSIGLLDPPTFTADGELIKETNNFTYLGVNIKKTGDRSKEITRRITTAKAMLFKLDNIWRSHEIALKTKITSDYGGKNFKISMTYYKRT